MFVAPRKIQHPEKVNLKIDTRVLSEKLCDYSVSRTGDCDSSVLTT